MRFAIALVFLCATALAQETKPPLSLEAATSTALQQVSTLRQAELDEKIAAEDVHQAWASLLPRARDSYTITYSSPGFIAANAIHEYQNLYGFAGELDFGMMAAVRRSRALLAAARAGTAVARRALVRGVSEAYFGAALAIARRSAADTSLGAATEFERVTCLNFDAGEVPEVDCIRARLQTSQRRDDLLQAREAEAVANAQLGTLLGITPTIEPLPQSIDVTANYARADVAKRPEFAQLDAQVRAAHADIQATTGALLPHITYSLDKGFDSPSLQSSELRQHRGKLATANVDIPIFDWGLSFSKVKQAQLRAREAEVQRELMTRDLYLQFATARAEFDAAAERVTNAQRALADAEKNETISISRYRAGEAPISEATDAQSTLAQQRLTLQQALFDFQIARAKLKEAAGE